MSILTKFFETDLTSSTNCPICSSEYAAKESIPKVLTCGHTFCLKCLSGLIIDLQVCIICEESVSGPIYKFPTNFALLEVENQEDKIKDLKLKKKEIGNKLKKEQMLLEKNFKIMKKSEEMLNSCLEAVNKWDDVKIDNHQEYPNMVKDMEEKLRDLDFSLYSCYKSCIKADFSLRYEDNEVEFMKKIVVELIRENNMYAFNSEWYNDDIFWGKVSYDNKGKLYIHSFTSDIPTTKCLLVPLIDLKNCFEHYNFQTFIDISGNRIVCNMTSSSKLSHDFIKLCSGEDGTSFKGLTSTIKPFSKKGEETMILKINLPQKDSKQNHNVLEPLPTEKNGKSEDEFKAISEPLSTETNGKSEDEFKAISEPLSTETNEISEDEFQVKLWDEKCEIVKYSKLQNSKEIESDGVVVATARSSAEKFLHPYNSENEYNSKNDGHLVEDCGLIIILSSDL